MDQFLELLGARRAAMVGAAVAAGLVARGRCVVSETTRVHRITPAQHDALMILANGPASKSVRNHDDPAAGLRSVNGKIANELIAVGMVREIPQWRAVELTDAGREYVG